MKELTSSPKDGRARLKETKLLVREISSRSEEGHHVRICQRKRSIKRLIYESQLKFHYKRNLYDPFFSPLRGTCKFYVKSMFTKRLRKFIERQANIVVFFYWAFFFFFLFFPLFFFLQPNWMKRLRNANRQKRAIPFLFVFFYVFSGCLVSFKHTFAPHFELKHIKQ